MPALAVAIALGAMSGGAARAQQPAPPPAAPQAPVPASPSAATTREGALLKVQVIISRYQGEKKISSQPYTLSVMANGPRATLRTGVQVPVPASPLPTADGKTPPVAINYKNVGTSIDCTARPLEDGRFRLELSIDDSSLATDDQSPPFAKGLPQFRSLQISGETAVLRDAQTTQLVTAADKVSGEVVRVDVTLNVVK
jgi:hypothetical protein